MLAVVADTWVGDLQDPDTIYTKVGPEGLFAHLQVGCTGRHALVHLALNIEMQRYHLEVEGIPEYINMLKDAQRQAGRAGRTITDETLVLFASIAMLTSERFTRANNYWEDRAERDKTWATWKLSYKQAHAKVRVKAQATDGSVKLGAANSAARQEAAHLPLDNQLEEDSGDVKTLEGYFDNLDASVANENDVLKQLVLNNTTLATSNESLVALVKKQNNEIRNLEQEIFRIKKGGKSSARNPPTLCANCKKEGYHQPQDCYGLAKNKDKRPPGWRSAL